MIYGLWKEMFIVIHVCLSYDPSACGVEYVYHQYGANTTYCMSTSEGIIKNWEKNHPQYVVVWESIPYCIDKYTYLER